jgi:hypothetical protein
MTHHPQFENGTPFRSSTFYPFKELLFHDYFLQVVRVREREREKDYCTLFPPRPRPKAHYTIGLAVALMPFHFHPVYDDELFYGLDFIYFVKSL